MPVAVALRLCAPPPRGRPARTLAILAILVSLLSLLSLAALTEAAHAGGLFVAENGAQALQRGGAFVARADDPTAVLHNPAGLTRADEKQAYLGVNLLSMDATFERAGNYPRESVNLGRQPAYVGERYPRVASEQGPLPIPFLALTIPHNRFAFSLAVFTPHGGAGRYAETVRTASGAEAPAPQRYDATSQNAIVVQPSVAVAYRFSDRLSLGARVSWVYASIDTLAYGQAVPNEAEQRGLDTRARVKATDSFTPQLALGGLYRYRNWEFGLAWQGGVTLDLQGTANIEIGDTLRNPLPGVEIELVPVPDSEARCAPGGTRGAVKACVSFSLPQVASAGARWIARDEDGDEVGDLELDLRWEDWSAAAEQRALLDVQDNVIGSSLGETTMRTGFHDSYSIRLGGSRRFRRESFDLTPRGGVAYDTAAAPLSWTRLAFDGAPRYTVAAGLGIDFFTWRIDVGAAYVGTPTRVVVDQPTPPGGAADRIQPDIPAPLTGESPANPFNAGVYRRSFLIGSVGVTFQI